MRRMLIFKNRKAMMGVGVLLIFIATILTSAVAAGVLIRTSGSLQTKTIEIEKTSRERLTTGLEFFRIYTYPDVDAGNTNKFAILTRLKPGSAAMSLTDLIIAVSTEDEDIEYLLYENNSINGTLYCDFDNLTESKDFCIEYLFGNTNLIIEEEEVAYLKFKTNSSNPIQPNDYIAMRFIPRTGEMVEMSTKIPSMKTAKIEIY